jgi:hypothetical protein
MRKLIFTFTEADGQTKLCGIIALILALAAILLLGVSTGKALYGPMLDLPVVDFFMPDNELDNLEDEYKDTIKELENALDEEDKDKLKEFEREYDMDAEEILDAMDPLSLNSMKVLSGVMGDGVEADIFSTIFSVLFGFGVVLMALVGLSALFMNRVFFILSVIFSAIFFFVLVGAVWFFVFLALCVAYCIFVSKVRSAYRNS